MIRSTPRNLVVILAVSLLGLLYLFERSSTTTTYDEASTLYADDLAHTKSERLSYLAHLGGGAGSNGGVKGDRQLTPQEAFVEEDGLLYLSDRARPGANPGYRVEHPILYLIRQAKSEWKDKLDRQSRDLKTAVEKYRKKYGRAPPRGFDKW